MFADDLRAIAGKLPGVTEDIKWGNDLCFCVAKKMFCVTPLEGAPNVSFKVTDEEFDELCARKNIIPAPYMARAKWVMVNNPAVFSKKEWVFYIGQSYQLVASKLPKKTRIALGIVQ
jgi:predicted DNA-binding protein (MmcQ/YjbR family)